MTCQMSVAAVLTALATGVFASTEGYPFARTRLAEPTVAVQRASESDTAELVANAPFLPGDRVWSDGVGRAEFQLFDGSLLWINIRTKLDYAAGSPSSTPAPLVLQLWSGALTLDRRQGGATPIDVETGAATVRVDPGALVRIDANPDAARVSVRQGTAHVDADDGRVSVQAGESTTIRPGGPPQASWRTDDSDDFDAWTDARAAAVAPSDSRYLPEELAAYAGELDQNGSWSYEEDTGYVWRPRVEADWSPYSSGHWTWTVIGWTWVPDESWGWAPSHYGRWGHSARLGWYWIPDRVFGPAWVSWALGSDHIGWCALDRSNRAIRHATAADGRGPRGEHDGWTFVRRADFSARDLHARRAANAVQGSAQLRVFEANNKRPDRMLGVAMDARRPVLTTTQRDSTWLRRPEGHREPLQTFTAQPPDPAPATDRQRARGEPPAHWFEKKPDSHARERTEDAPSQPTTRAIDLSHWLNPQKPHEDTHTQSPAPPSQEQRSSHGQSNLVERILGHISSAQHDARPQASPSSAQPHERQDSAHGSSETSRSTSDGTSERHPSRHTR